MNEKINVTRSSMPDFDEYVGEIRDIWDTRWLTNMGVKHNELEQKLNDYLSVEHVSLFSNGHMALELAIQAMGLTGEVITTPFTFASTTHAIVRNGLTPVFCDITPDEYVIDADKIESLITEKTSAIVPVHVYGNLCDVEKIEKIAQKYNLKVLYDAAHAFGVSYKGVGVGSFGDVSMFSFHATKVYNTIEGGAICYHDEKFGKRLYQLKNFGIKDQVTVDGIGANAKMNEFAAAMGLCNLRHIDEEIASRKEVFERYMSNLEGIDGIVLPKPQSGVVANYAYFPIVFEPEAFGASRNEVFDRLLEQKIFSRKYFYPITSSFDCYKGRFDPSKTPIAFDVSEKVLTVPMYAHLPLETVDKICSIIKSC